MQLTQYVLSTLIPLVTAVDLRVTVPPSPALANPSLLPPSTHASLTTLSKVYSSPLRVDNSFDFRNITTGSYLLDVHCHSHGFAPLRVDVREKTGKGTADEVSVWGTFRGNEWENKGEVVGVTLDEEGGVWSFEVKSLGAKEYLVERQGFSPLSILKNPMMLLAGASLILVFGMPYLMDNIDPDLKAEFEKSKQVQASKPPSAIQNFDAAAWLAGKSTSGSSTPRAEPAEKGVSR